MVREGDRFPFFQVETEVGSTSLKLPPYYYYYIIIVSVDTDDDGGNAPE